MCVKAHWRPLVRQPCLKAGFPGWMLSILTPVGTLEREGAMATRGSGGPGKRWSASPSCWCVSLPGLEHDQLGVQLTLSFWAWGDDEAEAMAQVDRTLSKLSAVLRGVKA